MKCLYYLSPTLDISQKVSDDLHAVGQQDWYLHVISKDESGLIQKHIQASNYIETLDLFRGTTVGGALGFIAALIAVSIAYYAQPFGQPLPNIAYIAFVLFLTLFGVWEGGLYGIDSENKKIRPFHDDIENGKCLILVYADKEKETAITSMMKEKHPESELVGVDRHFINPFSKVKLV